MQPSVLVCTQPRGLLSTCCAIRLKFLSTADKPAVISGLTSRTLLRSTYEAMHGWTAPSRTRGGVASCWAGRCRRGFLSGKSSTNPSFPSSFSHIHSKQHAPCSSDLPPSRLYQGRLHIQGLSATAQAPSRHAIRLGVDMVLRRLVDPWETAATNATDG